MLDGSGSFNEAFYRGSDGQSKWLPWRGSNEGFDSSINRNIDTDAPLPIAEPLVYSADAEQFFDRVEFQGPTREALYAALIDALVTAGVWSKLDALWILAAREEPTALANLKSSSFTATKNNTPVFEIDRGYTGSDGAGTSSYLNSTFNPSTAPSPQFTQNSAHISAWQITTTSEDVVIMGQGSGVNIFPRFAGDAYTRVNDNAEMAGTAVATPAGHTLGNRSTSSARQSYKDGASILTDNANTSKAVTNTDMLLLASNAGATISNKQAAVFSIGSSLTSTEVADFFTALDAYLTAVGAAAADAQTIEPPLFTNNQTFFGPTVKLNLAPALFTNNQTFFGPTVELNIRPGLFTNNQTFFGPTLRMDQELLPSLHINNQTFFGPTVKLNIVVPLFTNNQQFFLPTLKLNLKPTLFTNNQTFFAPTIKLNLNPGLFTNAQTFFAPTIELNIAPTLFTNISTIFPPLLLQDGANQTLVPPLLTNNQTFFSATLELNIVVPLFTNVQTFFAPSVELNILPPLLTNTSVLFPPTLVTTGDQVVRPPLLENANVFFTLTVSTPAPVAPEVTPEFPLSRVIRSRTNREVGLSAIPPSPWPINSTTGGPPRTRVRRRPGPIR